MHWLIYFILVCLQKFPLMLSRLYLDGIKSRHLTKYTQNKMLSFERKLFSFCVCILQTNTTLMIIFFHIGEIIVKDVFHCFLRVLLNLIFFSILAQ